MAGREAARLEFDAHVLNVASARRFVRETLTDVPLPVVHDVQLIASELVTNAIEHGPGGPVTVEIDRTADVVELTVRSPNPAGDIEGPQQWEIPSSDALSGRGFGIVRQVADRVEIRRSDLFLTIVARRRI